MTDDYAYEVEEPSGILCGLTNNHIAAFLVPSRATVYVTDSLVIASRQP